jgi:hypothetical protein
MGILVGFSVGIQSGFSVGFSVGWVGGTTHSKAAKGGGDGDVDSVGSERDKTTARRRQLHAGLTKAKQWPDVGKPNPKQ